MKRQSSNGKYDNSSSSNTSAFHEKFKGKMSCIGKQGPNEAFLGNLAKKRGDQKENFLPPIKEPSRLALGSGHYHTALQPVSYPNNERDEVQRRPYATMPTKQSTACHLLAQQKKYEAGICQSRRRTDQQYIGFDSALPSEQDNSRNPLRLSMTSDEDFQLHLDRLQRFRRN